MDYDTEITALAGETLAVTWVLGRLLNRLNRAGPETRTAVAAVFEDATRISDKATGRFGAIAPQHMQKAFQVIEELHRAAVSDE